MTSLQTLPHQRREGDQAGRREAQMLEDRRLAERDRQLVCLLGAGLGPATIGVLWGLLRKAKH